MKSWLESFVTFLNFPLWLELRELRRQNREHYQTLLLAAHMRSGGFEMKPRSLT